MTCMLLVWRRLITVAIAGSLVLATMPVASVQAALCQKMFIPAYFYPGPLWDQAIAASSTVGYMVMNPASGPGTAQNFDYVSAVNRAQAVGIKVLGYVHTSYGARATSTVEAEINAYKAWYGVSGIFLDETATDPALIPYYQELANYIRASAGTFVALNPGTIPDQGYMAVGDTVVVFEGSYTTYKTWTPPSWAGSYPASKFVHLIYATGTTTNMKNAVNLSKSRQGGNVYVTNDVLPNPWDTLPSYWSSELNQIGAC